MTKILKEDLTQELLHEFLHYCPLSGDFTYVKKTGKKSVIGAKAGSISKRDGHLEIRFFGSLYRANRLAWFYTKGYWPKFVDHEDHNELNNRWDNLRDVTQQVNNMNMPRKGNNTSGHTGVWWSTQKDRWISEIMLNGKKSHLGMFTDINDAVAARSKAERDMGFHPNHGKP